MCSWCWIGRRSAGTEYLCYDDDAFKMPYKAVGAHSPVLKFTKDMTAALYGGRQTLGRLSACNTRCCDTMHRRTWLTGCCTLLRPCEQPQLAAGWGRHCFHMGRQMLIRNGSAETSIPESSSITQRLQALPSTLYGQVMQGPGVPFGTYPNLHGSHPCKFRSCIPFLHSIHWPP